MVVSLIIGDAADHTFAALLDVAIQPAAVLLPVAGVLLVTSEWSQRTGLITFALVPVRSRVLGAKLLASLVLAVAMFAAIVAIVAAGVLAGGTGDAWTDVAPLIGQTTVFLTAGMVTAVAFGAILLSSAPALVALFALPSSWAALVSLSFFGGIGPWVDTARSLSPMHEEVMSGAQWAHAGTSLAIWMAIPLADRHLADHAARDRRVTGRRDDVSGTSRSTGA